MLYNCFPFTPIIMKLYTTTSHELKMCPIDFEVKRSKVKVTGQGHNALILENDFLCIIAFPLHLKS